MTPLDDAAGAAPRSWTEPVPEFLYLASQSPRRLQRLAVLTRVGQQQLVAHADLQQQLSLIHI